MSSVYACMLFLFFVVLNPVSLAAGATNSSGAAGFSLPLVPHYRTEAGVLEELLPEGDAEGGVNITSIRPKMIPLTGPVYSVRVGVGSGETQHFYKLALDLVRPLTWIRCRPCIPEKKQEGSIFNTAVSPHYHAIASTDRRCTAPYKRGSRGRCIFDVKYQYHGSSAQGFLSTDNFAFDGSGPGSHISGVDGLVFGCAHSTHQFDNHGVWAGVMSLNRHPTSLIRQLSDRGLAASRFSYCLVGKEHEHLHRRGFLRFGADIPDQPHARSTALLHGELAQGGGMYYVHLVGISLGGRRLTAITPAMFERDPRTLRGGCTVDVGTSHTLLAPDAYHILAAEVVAHLQSRGVHRAPGPVQNLKLCFRGAWDSIRAHFPSVTLHFDPESAVLFIKPELLFLAVTHQHTHYACFTVVPYAERSVIGAGQMLDTRFTFDLQHNRLFFAPEDCHLDTSAVGMT
ncbi:aspartic proteinase nepenthesin-2-like [Aegilops tauschii subsp. strangulata]|uniref:Peptidase A1 domain-containing protein n=1 Tax=Aegilops tauschii subsp. strangulata TaxID=200361 RepID=A0A453APT3_AEGTS|nr:protein ASPARTIC PROTEASE IN GUARD CELL 1-like [Aegilops tauschii subsp. strangulata]